MHHLILKASHVHFIFTSTPQYAFIGGGERDRTDDLLRARQALSQLSYTPKIVLVFCVLSSLDSSVVASCT